jgi:hypothetical protein
MKKLMASLKTRSIGVLVAALGVLATLLWAPSAALAATAIERPNPDYITLENGGNYEFTLTHKPQNRLVPDGFSRQANAFIQVYGGDFGQYDRFWTVTAAPGHWTMDGMLVQPYQLRYRPSNNVCMTVHGEPADNAYLWQQPCAANFTDQAQLWLIKKGTTEGSYKLVPWSTRTAARLVVGPESPNSEDTWVRLQAPGRNNDWVIADEAGNTPRR